MHGLHMARISEVFDGPPITFDDLRFTYGEDRHLTNLRNWALKALCGQ
jgi:uncharacterized DUF497 family protein